MKRKIKAGNYTLSIKQVKLLINSETNFRNRTILKCLYYGGLRREEVATMQVEDVNFQERYMKIVGKFDKMRYVPFINAQFMGDLLTYIGKRKRGYVFIKEDGGHLTNRMINYICEKAGEKAESELVKPAVVPEPSERTTGWMRPAAQPNSRQSIMIPAKTLTSSD